MKKRILKNLIHEYNFRSLQYAYDLLKDERGFIYLAHRRKAFAGFKVKAVTFDGTNDWISRASDFSGNADGKTGIFSLWFNLQGGNGNLQNFYYCGGGVSYIQRTADDAFTNNRFADGVTGNGYKTSTTNTYQSGGGWVHALYSWDVANNLGHMYFNDSDVETSNTNTNVTIDYTVATHLIGAADAGANKFNGYMAEVYMNFAEYLDITVEANRRKFISAAGKPVELGDTGALPTGSQPICYQSVRPGDSASDFITNRGSGGNFTENGALALSPSSPSD